MPPSLPRGYPIGQNSPNHRSPFHRDRDQDQTVDRLVHPHPRRRELLLWSFEHLGTGKASGVDGVSVEAYGRGLEKRLKRLLDRLHRGAYHPQPSRRRWIPKGNGRRRPLGIPATEDKLVQRAVAAVLTEIYEEEFYDFSYGFRPGRGLRGQPDQNPRSGRWIPCLGRQEQRIQAPTTGHERPNLLAQTRRWS